MDHLGHGYDWIYNHHHSCFSFVCHESSEGLKDQKLGLINANYADQSMLKVFPTVNCVCSLALWQRFSWMGHSDSTQYGSPNSGRYECLNE